MYCLHSILRLFLPFFPDKLAINQLVINKHITYHSSWQMITASASSLQHTPYGIDPSFFSHRVDSGTDPRNVNRPPSLEQFQYQSRDGFAFTQNHSLFCGNFLGSTFRVKGIYLILKVVMTKPMTHSHSSCMFLHVYSDRNVECIL